MTARGLFVSLEGIDGSGKSTQARRLADTLRAEGHPVILTREPGGSAGAEEIRALLLRGDPDRWSAETELLLFNAARRDHLERTIRPALDRGEIVICDRFADSTRMYQGLSRGNLRSMADTLHGLMIGIEPDLTLLIDMDPRVALSRSLSRLAAGEAAPPDAAADAPQDTVCIAGAGAAAADPARRAAQGDAGQSARDDAGRAARDMASDAPAAGPAGAIRPERDGAGPAPAPGSVENRFEAFGLSLQERMRAGFLDLAGEFPGRFRVIDGDRDADAILADLLAAVRPRLP